MSSPYPSGADGYDPVPDPYSGGHGPGWSAGGVQPGSGYPYAAPMYDPAAPPPPYGMVAPGPGYQMQPYGPMPSRKEPVLSLILSFFFPGVGSMVNGEVGKGVLILCLYFFAVVMSFVLIGLPFMFGIWIWGMIDAYQGAQNHNARYGLF